MKLPALSQLKLAAILALGLVFLGCEAPATSANDETPAVTPAATVAEQPQLAPAPNAPPAPAAEASELAPSAEALQPPPKAPVVISDRLKEVVKLAQSGVGDDVILAYIESVPTAFNPTPEEIVYLTDLGVSDVVITALVNHKAAQAPAPAPTAPALVTTTPPGAQPQVPPPGVVPQPAPTYNPEAPVVYSSPPVVEYTPPPEEVAPFYSSLSPYGSWMELPDYGWCWQPTVVVVQRDWRPYCDRGHWIYSDCGWYWFSDYSWGWAPFHYGRWFHHPHRGWCWKPDGVWAPAWVSWRYSDAYCGWAPLPPGAHFYAGSGFAYYGAHVGVSFGFGLGHDAWTFVPAGHFHDREVWRHRMHGPEVVNIYHHTTIVNNYAVDEHHNVINHGIDHRHVPALARAEATKVSIRATPERAASVRPERLNQEGSQLVLYRPKIGNDTARTIPSQPAARSGIVANPAATSSPGQGTGGRRGGFSQTTPATGSPSGRVQIQPVGKPEPVTERTAERSVSSSRPVTTTPSVNAVRPGGTTAGTAVSSTPTPVTRGPSTTVSRSEPVRSWSLPATAQPSTSVRQEPSTAAVAPVERTYSQPATQANRAPAATPNPSWNQRGSVVSSPSSVAERTAPVQTAPSRVPSRQDYGQQAARSAPSAGQEQRSWGYATPSYQVPRNEVAVQSRNVAPPSYVSPMQPSYSAPAPARIAPSYSPAPAPVQPSYSAPAPSRAAPSYSPAPARQAPASAPAPVMRSAPQSSGGTVRSNNQRQQ